MTTTFQIELEVCILIAAELFMINFEVSKCEAVSQRVLELSCSETDTQTDNRYFLRRSTGFGCRSANFGRRDAIIRFSSSQKAEGLLFLFLSQPCLPHLLALDELGEHDDEPHFLLVHHLPECVSCRILGTLRRYVLHVVSESLRTRSIRHQVTQCVSGIMEGASEMDVW